MHKPYSAFFVGTPSNHEQSIIQDVQLFIDFHVVAANDVDVGRILQAVPDYVMLPLTYANKLALQLFHRLRKDGRTCMVVWGEQTLTAFSGRGYRWRQSVPKDVQGLEHLMEWGKWPMPVSRRMCPGHSQPATATRVGQKEKESFLGLRFAFPHTSLLNT